MCIRALDFVFFVERDSFVSFVPVPLLSPSKSNGPQQKPNPKPSSRKPMSVNPKPLRFIREFPKIGDPYSGVLIIGILVLRVLD